MDVRNLGMRKMELRDFVYMYVSFINLFRTSQKIYNFKRQGSPVSRFIAYLFFGVRKTAHYIQQPDNIK